MAETVLPTDGSPVHALFTQVDHVGIAVPDLDDAIAFYRRTFGLVSVHEETNTALGVREAMLAVGGGSTRLQLLAPIGPDSVIARFLERSGPGVQQVAYTVADLDAVCRTLRARGLRLLYDVPRQGTAHSRVNFIHPRDAGGVLVELVEPAGAASAEDQPGSTGQDGPNPVHSRPVAPAQPGAEVER